MTHPALTSYFQLINDERWDEFGSIWAEDAVLVSVGTAPRQGRDQIVQHFSRLFRAFSQHLDTPTRFLQCGDVVTVEVHFDGATLDGRPITFDAVDVFDLSGDTIVKLSTWYDPVALRRQMQPPAQPTG